MKQSVPTSVNEYITAQPEPMRSKLEQVRAAIKKTVPVAVEGIGYRMPGYELHGRPMLYFAGFKEHYSFFAASGTFFVPRPAGIRRKNLTWTTGLMPALVDRAAEVCSAARRYVAAYGSSYTFRAKRTG